MQGVYEDWATNHHVDNFCCFVRPGAVLLAWTDDQSDPQVSPHARPWAPITPASRPVLLQVCGVRLPLAHQHPTARLALQYEACQQAMELLECTPDAQGRKLQVYKVYLPPNLFLSEAEAEAMVVSFRGQHSQQTWCWRCTVPVDPTALRTDTRCLAPTWHELQRYTIGPLTHLAPAAGREAEEESWRQAAGLLHQLL